MILYQKSRMYVLHDKKSIIKPSDDIKFLNIMTHPGKVVTEQKKCMEVEITHSLHRIRLVYLQREETTDILSE